MLKVDSHPKTLDVIRTYLARNSLITLVLHFLLIIIATSLIFSNILFILNNKYSIFSFFKFCFLQLLGKDYQDEIINYSSIFQIILYSILSVLSLVLPALFFGAIVFKLFIKKGMITFRKIISVFWLPERKKNILGIRLYNSSKLLLVDITFKVFIRIKYASVDGSPQLQNIQLDILNPVWPIALTHVPFTIQIPLDENDILQKNKKKQEYLTSVQKNRLGTENRILVIVKGCIPDLGTDFIETYWYSVMDDFKFGKYYDIDVDNNIHSKKWNGWINFDKNK